MGSSRGSSDQQQQELPEDQSAAQQQDMFGDMMRAQAQNRQNQIARRKQRVGFFAQDPGAFMGQQWQQQASPFAGLLQQLMAQQQQPQQPQNPYQNYEGS